MPSPLRPGVLTALLLALFAAAPAHAGVVAALTPTGVTVQPGDTITVELTVPEGGDPFNGYDAVVGYEPDRLLFLRASPLAQQEGPLFVEACPSLRFHLFDVAADSTTLTINHVMLCAATTVTGPGVLYRLRFMAKGVPGPTHLDLLAGTRFYDAGADVTPVETAGAVLTVGTTTDAPAPPRTGLELRAAPNPFNPRTVLSFDLARAGRTRLTVYAVDGRRVRTLLEESLPAGPHRVAWDGRDSAGRPVASGPYLARLEAPAAAVAVRTLTLLK